MKLSNQELIKRLEPPAGKIRMVLDTDTYNEVDDQFALAYAIASPDKLCVEAVYAAPFLNNRAANPADGMEKSYREILNILRILGVSREDFVFRGSKDYLKTLEDPRESDAANDLIKRALEGEEPLYVASIGAITNIASAIIMNPDIIEKIVVVWLGGHSLHWRDTNEFNLRQDVIAARTVFDSGVPLIHIPCEGVASGMLTTIPELEYYLSGKSAIGSYLTGIVKNYTDRPFGWSKVIWDVSTIAWLINPGWVPTDIVHSPIVTDQLTWSFDFQRHLIRSAASVRRDLIFADLFRKLAGYGEMS